MSVPRPFMQSDPSGRDVSWTGHDGGRFSSTGPSSACRGDGPEHRSVLKRSESRPTVHQLHPEQIQRSILRVLEQEMAGKVRAIHAVVVDPLDPMKIPSSNIGLKVSPNGIEEGLGRRAFHVQINVNGEPWQTIDAIADVSASIDAVVPTRVIQIDSVIEAEDVTVHRIKLTDLDHQLITEREGCHWEERRASVADQ